MDILTKNKGILSVVVVFIVAIYLYNIFFKSETMPVTSELSASSIGDDLLKIHGELQRVTLDRAIFSSTGYLLLNDFSTVISPQTTGRPNPFNIIGRD